MSGEPYEDALHCFFFLSLIILFASSCASGAGIRVTKAGDSVVDAEALTIDRI